MELTTVGNSVLSALSLLSLFGNILFLAGANANAQSATGTHFSYDIVTWEDNNRIEASFVFLRDKALAKGRAFGGSWGATASYCHNKGIVIPLNGTLRYTDSGTNYSVSYISSGADHTIRVVGVSSPGPYAHSFLDLFTLRLQGGSCSLSYQHGYQEGTNPDPQPDGRQYAYSCRPLALREFEQPKGHYSDECRN